MKSVKFAATVAFCLVSIIFRAVSIAGAAEKSPPYLDTKLSWDARVADLVSRMTDEEKISLMNNTAAAVPRLGIKGYQVWNEALHGVARLGNFTVFPQAVAMASTWDPWLILKESTAISDEAWAAINRDAKNGGGYPPARMLTWWSPTINMARDPRWGRTPETYGEDPYLTGRIAVSFVRGLQGIDPRYIKCVSTPKHFAANNEEHNRIFGNAWVSEKTLREYYFPAFKAAVQQGGAMSVMGAYNAVNYVPSNANRWLLTDVLRDDWGFKGFVVTDCGAGEFVFNQHHYAKTEEDAATLLLKAGVSIECGSEVMRKNLLAALHDGLITEDELNLNVSRLLDARFRLGMFDPPEMNPYTKIPETMIGSPEHIELARQVSRESIVLLKNDEVGGAPLLPIDLKKAKSIAVVGPYAATLEFGEYSGTPVGTPVTPLDGITKRTAGKAEINFVQWQTLPFGNEYKQVPEGVFMTGGDKSEPGLAAQYFDGLSHADGIHAHTAKRVEATLDTSSAAAPDSIIGAGPVNAIWNGVITPEKSGEYFFFVTSKNSDSEMFVDGKSVMKFAPVEKKKSPFQSGKNVNLGAEDIKPEIKRAAVVMMEGGKSYGVEVRSASEKGAPSVRLTWVPPSKENTEAADKFFKAVPASDVVLAFMGIGQADESEGHDRATLDLPAGQTEFVEQLSRLNKNVIVVLISGSPLSINWMKENTPAILEAWYPGEQGGNAIADVLFGAYNPAGRLTMTYFKSVDDLPAFNDYEISHGRTYMYFDKEPLFPFGFGLSYTTFGYFGVKLDKEKVKASDKINVTFTLTNTGGASGDEVVQLYVRDVDPKVKRPIKRLRGFQRVYMKKGDSKTITIPLSISEIAYWDDFSRKFVVTPGKYEVLIGASSADIRLKAGFEVVE